MHWSACDYPITFEDLGFWTAEKLEKKLLRNTFLLMLWNIPLTNCIFLLKPRVYIEKRQVTGDISRGIPQESVA